MNLRIKVKIYDEDTEEEIDGFDTYIEETRTFEQAEMHLGSLIRRVVKKYPYEPTN